MGRRKLRLPQRIAIQQLLDQGHSAAQVAKALNLTPSQCKTGLDEARGLLEASAPKLVEDYLNASHHAAIKGDHRPARDMLDRIKVTEPTASDVPPVGIRVEITAGFRMPGLPVQVTSEGVVQYVPASPAPALPPPDPNLTIDVPMQAAHTSSVEWPERQARGDSPEARAIPTYPLAGVGHGEHE